MNKEELMRLTRDIAMQAIDADVLPPFVILKWLEHVTEAIRQYDEDKSKEWNNLDASEKEAIIGSYESIEEQEP